MSSDTSHWSVGSTIAEKSIDAMHPIAGFGHLDSIVDDIKKKENERVKLESELRQTRLRAESEAAGASHLKSDLEVALAERITLQKQIGLLSRKNEDLAGENAKLVEEKCDFQRSMANNEAKLKENEADLRRAQRGFVDDLEKANRAYTRNRAMMNTLLGREGAGCAEIPSYEELDDLKADAAKLKGISLRAEELEARFKALEAESHALRAEAAERIGKHESLRSEIATLKVKLTANSGDKGEQRTPANRGSHAGNERQQQRGPQHGEVQRQQKHITQLEQEIADLDDTCRRQGVYINELEEYANSVEAANAELLQQQGSKAHLEDGPDPRSAGQDVRRSTDEDPMQTDDRHDTGSAMDRYDEREKHMEDGSRGQHGPADNETRREAGDAP